MKNRNRSIVFLGLIATLAAALIMSGNSLPARADTTPRVINIAAKRFEFSPSQITLKKGETVKLVLTTQDVTHGFFSKPLKIDEVIEPGKTTEVTVTPQVTGTFTTICDHFCGVNHGNMKMTFLVTE